MDIRNSPGRPEVFAELAEVLKALGNGRRLQLLEFLAQGEHSVDELARLAGMQVTTVSSNLKSLREAGLACTRREGTTVFYSLAGDDVAHLLVAAERVARARSPRLRETVDAFLAAASETADVPAIAPRSVTSEMTVIDVRPDTEFAAGHFPGARSIPLEELPTRWREIPAHRSVALYCRGEFCRLAREAAAWLRTRGIDAAAMDAGVLEWRATGEVVLDAAA